MYAIRSYYAPRHVPEELPAAQTQWMKTQNMLSVELLFTKEMAPIICDWWELEECEDGRLRVYAMLPDTYQTYGFV